jgi:hypothetical protein
VLSVSLNFIHPHNDFEDMGNCAVVITDGLAGEAAARSTAAALADSFAHEFWARAARGSEQ